MLTEIFENITKPQQELEEMASKATVWAHKLRQKNIEKFGGKCKLCSQTDPKELEFHHKKETELKGRSRGSVWRAIDVRNHPKSYELLCDQCHIVKHAKEVVQQAEEVVNQEVAPF